MTAGLKNRIKKVLASRGYSITRTKDLVAAEKYEEEVAHWKRSFNEYQQWYNGDIEVLWGENPPADDIKIKDYDIKTNSILTWQLVHQRSKYLEYLQLSPDAFSGMTLLDLGSGPHPSALGFENCKVYCLDPLFPEYMRIGFPFHCYEERVKFAFGYAERMPFPDRFFDAVVSVNAIDHVDDFEKTALEINRIIKPQGKLRMHIHYHKPTPTEPLELNDTRMMDAFHWCENLKKINETKERRGGRLTNPEECYALWSNY